LITFAAVDVVELLLRAALLGFWPRRGLLYK
jgi:hypothetical protein